MYLDFFYAFYEFLKIYEDLWYVSQIESIELSVSYIWDTQKYKKTICKLKFWMFITNYFNL